MLKREYNSEYAVKLLEGHSVEPLQPPPYMPLGRNKHHIDERGKKAVG